MVGRCIHFERLRLVAAGSSKRRRPFVLRQPLPRLSSGRLPGTWPPGRTPLLLCHPSTPRWRQP
eukprot:4430774-Prorocentrum_lima.AAC.1